MGGTNLLGNWWGSKGSNLFKLKDVYFYIFPDMNVFIVCSHLLILNFINNKLITISSIMLEVWYTVHVQSFMLNTNWNVQYQLYRNDNRLSTLFISAYLNVQNETS